MTRAVRWMIAMVALVAVTACIRTRPVPDTRYWLTSDSSEYSPVVAFRVRSRVDSGGVHVAIDSGVIAAPGPRAAAAPVVMRNLFLTAYVASSNFATTALATSDTRRFADRRGWRAIAESDSVRILDALRFGEARPVANIAFTLASPPAGNDARWLVFRVSGENVDLRLRVEDAAGLVVGSAASRVRVYACSDRDLNGQLDSTRSNGLRRAYGLLC